MLPAESLKSPRFQQKARNTPEILLKSPGVCPLGLITYERYTKASCSFKGSWEGEYFLHSTLGRETKSALST